ncbi:secretion system protein [Acidaminobacter sp. JC074]|uniref:type II secretion system F family protein n=1 Tax=Acidaminobacter sp. JC074 TaxID=2530199 RepID=UPI001F0DA29F|nr:type II secretion system F family protein [Acidaminobacter sp. JC074]MCH4890441.1 secretion system protein [Acidaminobacter sp. JC074]
MLLGAIIVVFFFILIFIFWLFESLFVKERYIDRIKDLDVTRRVIEEKKTVQKKKKSPMRGLSRLVPKGKNNKMADKLVSANLIITAEELFIYRLLFSIALGFLAQVVRQDLVVTAGVVVFIWNIPKFFINRRIKNRVNDFNDQLNGGLILIANALKAGHSFMQAVSIAARETQGVFSEELKILLKELNFGIPMDVGFNNLLRRVNSPDMKLVVNAIMIQKDIGGNLAEILENISETIRERQKIINEMKTLTAQGKMSGMIVMLIPFFLGGMIYLLNREYIMLLFQTRVGMMILGGALMNEVIGVMFIRKIIKIDV